MLVPRTSLVRSVRQFRSLGVPKSAGVPAQWRQAGRKTYATAADAAEKAKHAGETLVKSSELPWAVTAGVVTVVGTYWILADGPGNTNAGLPGSKWHGHDHGEDEEEGGDEDEEGGEDKDEGGEGKDEGDDKEGDDKGDDGDDGAEKDDSKAKDGDDDKSEEDKSGDDDKGDDEGEGGDGKKGVVAEDDKSKTIRVDDAKGGVKRRVESKAGKKLGEDSEGGEASASKDAKPGSQHSKQAGLSNTDTKHPQGDDPEKSKKASGVPETAKVQGTVDPNREAK